MSEITGVVLSYKEVYEELLYREIKERWKGIYLIERSIGAAVFGIESYEDILRDIDENGVPVFLNHMHPVIKQVEISGTEQDISFYEGLIDEQETYLDKEKVWTFQARITAKNILPYQNGSLILHISNRMREKGFQVNSDEAEQAASLTVFDHNAYFGYGDIKNNISRWNGGILFFPKNAAVVCRAEFKLEEAVQFFHINLNGISRALDLGAAPGGWSHYLAGQNINVDAVDPAELSEQVKGCERIQHYKMTAQQFLKLDIDKKYDLIVNDMKMDAGESVDILLSMLPVLSENGQVIVTIKMPKKNFLKKISSAKNALRRYFKNVYVKHLYYNRSEVTMYAKDVCVEKDEKFLK